jgi:hypothetical protein
MFTLSILHSASLRSAHEGGRPTDRLPNDIQAKLHESTSQDNTLAGIVQNWADCEPTSVFLLE